VSLTATLQWGVRIAIGAYLLLSIHPVPARAILGPPAPVSTQHPILCVHTRLMDEVFEWKIQRSLELTNQMGATAIVEFFPWAYIETAPGQYNWAQADRVIKHARNQGLRVLARFGYVPPWAQEDAQTADFASPNWLPEARFDDFAAFAARFAERYRGQVDDFIIWNEPNLAFEWGYTQVDPAGYVDLLQRTYGAIKAINPEATILAGALAPTLEPDGSERGLNDPAFLEAMYRAGAAKAFDALAIHTYGFSRPATEDPARDILNFRRAELLLGIMEAHGDGDKPVFITESGWNDDERWIHAVSPAERIAETLASYRFVERNWPQAELMCTWVLRYPQPTGSYPDGFTLLTSELQPRPIYRALQAYAQGGEIGESLWLPPPTE
jgi:polysaccharide biosynthesis protein PslG